MEKAQAEVANLPEYLIYELDKGQPIYYDGYEEVLNNTKTLDQIMGSSVLQALLVELIKDFLKPLFGSDYVILAHEIGIKFNEKSWRNADIAVFSKKDLLRSGIQDKYAAFPPKLVIEIDTKAALKDLPHPEQYFHHKTDQLLDFGVEQVLWIFTASEKFMLAKKGKRWETGNWGEDLEIADEIVLNVKKLLDDFAQ